MFYDQPLLNQCLVPCAEMEEYQKIEKVLFCLMFVIRLKNFEFCCVSDDCEGWLRAIFNVNTRFEQYDWRIQ